MPWRRDKWPRSAGRNAPAAVRVAFVNCVVVTGTQPPQHAADLPPTWAPAEVAAGLYERWVDRGYFTADPTREAFVERVWQWKSEYGGKILNQMRRLGRRSRLEPRAVHHGRRPVQGGRDDLQAVV